MEPGHIWAPEGYPSQFGHHKGARSHMGTGRVQGHMLTGRVLRHIWAPEGCPGTYGHRKGAQEHMGTRMVPG